MVGRKLSLFRRRQNRNLNIFKKRRAVRTISRWFRKWRPSYWARGAVVALTDAQRKRISENKERALRKKYAKEIKESTRAFDHYSRAMEGYIPTRGLRRSKEYHRKMRRMYSRIQAGYAAQEAAGRSQMNVYRRKALLSKAFKTGVVRSFLSRLARKRRFDKAYRALYVPQRRYYRPRPLGHRYAYKVWKLKRKLNPLFRAVAQREKDFKNRRFVAVSAAQRAVGYQQSKQLSWKEKHIADGIQYNWKGGRFRMALSCNPKYKRVWHIAKKKCPECYTLDDKIYFTEAAWNAADEDIKKGAEP